MNEVYSKGRDLLERAFRNMLQTALPIAAAVAASGEGIDAGAVSFALVAVAVYTLIKGGIEATADADAPLPVQLLDRAGSAALATVLAFVPQEAMHSWADWASVDWKAVGLAAVASAAVALGQFYLSPPALARSRFDVAA